MGVELELAELLIIHLLASNFFARFEVETPAFRKIIKWLVIFGVTIGLYLLASPLGAHISHHCYVTRNYLPFQLVQKEWYRSFKSNSQKEILSAERLEVGGLVTLRN